MSQDNELRRLEQFVEKLLGRFSELRAEKAKLLQELRERELLIEDLRNSLSSKDMERSEISKRVSKIVEQIEEWEMGLEQSVAVAPGSEAPAGVEVTQVVNPSQVNEAVEGHRSEEEGRVQQNLFSIGHNHR